MTNNYLAQNLQFLRRRRKMSQQALGVELGLSRSNIASYENAKAEPRATMLVRIGRFFDITIDQLVDHPLDESAVSSKNKNFGKLDRLMRAQQTESANFLKKSAQLRKVIEGMKAYHELKRETVEDPGEMLLSFFKDYEYLLTVMESLVIANDELVQLVQPD
ncbi:MAG: helix-turn-helix transcriptional regulator [Saprospiraceae bacterium]|nr:helix-turn-helix transcriptional regulator [Saprospiraceae bacterium]